jgi:hypothetical protein
MGSAPSDEGEREQFPALVGTQVNASTLWLQQSKTQAKEAGNPGR